MIEVLTSVLAINWPVSNNDWFGLVVALLIGGGLTKILDSLSNLFKKDLKERVGTLENIVRKQGVEMRLLNAELTDALVKKGKVETELEFLVSSTGTERTEKEKEIKSLEKTIRELQKEIKDLRDIPCETCAQ